MSVAAMAWAWKQQTGSPTTKAVLLALADNADEDGICWPGVRGLTEKCELSERAVRTHLSSLASAGVVVVEPQTDGRGRQIANLYRLTLRESAMAPARRAPAPAPGAPTSLHDVHPSEENHPDEPSIEPSESASSRTHAREAQQSLIDYDGPYLRAFEEMRDIAGWLRHKEAPTAKLLARDGVTEGQAYKAALAVKSKRTPRMKDLAATLRNWALIERDGEMVRTSNGNGHGRGRGGGVTAPSIAGQDWDAIAARFNGPEDE